jgi:hypothetical protein
MINGDLVFLFRDFNDFVKNVEIKAGSGFDGDCGRAIQMM